MKRFWRSTTTDIDRHQLLSDLLDRNGRWIEVADAKAAVVLVFVTAVAGALVAPTTESVQHFQRALCDEPTIGDWAGASLLSLLVLLAGAPSILATWNAFKALIPDTKRYEDSGHLFFGDVARADLPEWYRWMRQATEQDVEKELAEQVHATARIALNKHRHVNQAIRAIVRFTIPSGIALLAFSTALNS